MRILALTFLTVGLVTAADQAPAQTYDPAFPVCAHVIPWGGGSFEDCTYYTMAQCAASASGRARSASPTRFTLVRQRRDRASGVTAGAIEPV